MTVATDTLTLTLRLLLRWAKQPGVQVFGLLFPVLLLLIWQWLLGGQFELPAGASYIDILLPGMLAVSMFFGLDTTTAGVAEEVRAGLTERLRSMPIAAASVLLGRVVAELLHATVGLLVVALAGLALGWDPQAGAGGLLAAFGLLLLLRLAMLWLGILYGLSASSVESVTMIQVAVWPVAFLSSAFVSTASMPAVLGTLAEWNPLSATATAVRDLVGAPGWGGGGWATDHATLLAVAWPVLIVAVLLPLAVRRYRRLGD